MHASVTLFPTNICRNFRWQEWTYLGTKNPANVCDFYLNAIPSGWCGCLRILNYLLFCFLLWCVALIWLRHLLKLIKTETRHRLVGIKSSLQVCSAIQCSSGNRPPPWGTQDTPNVLTFQGPAGNMGGEGRRLLPRHGSHAESELSVYRWYQ